MVCDLVTGNSFEAVIGYNMQEHKGKFIDSNVFLDDDFTYQEACNFFNTYKLYNQKVKNPVFHPSINFPDEDIAKLSENKVIEIGRKFLTRMGFDIDSGTSNQNPYLTYLHHDAGHVHIHIVASRISENGLVDLHNSYYKAMEVLREIEKEYGLRKVPFVKADVKKISKSERERNKRYRSMNPDYRSGREHILKTIGALGADKEECDLNDFVNHFKKAGIDIKFNTNKDVSKVNGLSFKLQNNGEDFVIKGSSLGKAFTWSRLTEFIDIDLKRDKELLMSLNQHKYDTNKASSLNASIQPEPISNTTEQSNSISQSATKIVADFLYVPDLTNDKDYYQNLPDLPKKKKKVKRRRSPRL